MAFPKGERSKIRDNEVPGPGSYKLPIKFADVPNYLIPNR
jgi:hypothetical protein